MIYPQLAQPSTPGSSLHFIPFTCHHNLLCHSDLPGLAILNKPPPMVQAKMSVVLLLSLPQLRRRPLVWQWEVTLHPHQALHCYLQTYGNMLRDEAAYCVANKSISAAGPRRSNRALYFGFVTCQNIWVNFALYSTVSKVMLCYERMSVMGRNLHC